MKSHLILKFSNRKWENDRSYDFRIHFRIHIIREHRKRSRTLKRNATENIQFIANFRCARDGFRTTALTYTQFFSRNEKKFEWKITFVSNVIQWHFYYPDCALVDKKATTEIPIQVILKFLHHVYLIHMSKSSSLGDERSRRYTSPSSHRIRLIVAASTFILNACLISFTRSKDELHPFLSLVLIKMKFFTDLVIFVSYFLIIFWSSILYISCQKMNEQVW